HPRNQSVHFRNHAGTPCQSRRRRRYWQLLRGVERVVTMCWRRNSVWTLRWAALAIVLGLAGCCPAFHPVHGQVSYEDGTPVTKGIVVFEAIDAKHPLTARGDLRADGSYQLGTKKPGD